MCWSRSDGVAVEDKVWAWHWNRFALARGVEDGTTSEVHQSKLVDFEIRVVVS